MPTRKAKRSPSYLDYVETRTEQGCLQIGITMSGVVAALVVFILGGIFDLRALDTVAGIILLVAVAAGVFVGWDVNYTVARMRERANENADGPAPKPADPSEEAQASSQVQPWIKEMRTRLTNREPPDG